MYTILHFFFFFLDFLQIVTFRFQGMPLTQLTQAFFWPDITFMVTEKMQGFCWSLKVNFNELNCVKISIRSCKASVYLLELCWDDTLKQNSTDAID